MKKFLAKIVGLATLVLIGFPGAQKPGMGKGMGGGRVHPGGMMGMGMSRACRMMMGSPADTTSARPVNPSGSLSPGAAPASPAKTAAQGKPGEAAPSR